MRMRNFRFLLEKENVAYMRNLHNSALKAFNYERMPNYIQFCFIFHAICAKFTNEETVTITGM